MESRVRTFTSQSLVARYGRSEETSDFCQHITRAAIWEKLEKVSSALDRVEKGIHYT